MGKNTTIQIIKYLIVKVTDILSICLVLNLLFWSPVWSQDKQDVEADMDSSEISEPETEDIEPVEPETEHSDDSKPETSQIKSSEEEFWGELYFEMVERKQSDYRFTGDANIKQGLHLFKIRGRDVDVYIKARYFHNGEDFSWRNTWEFGVGTRYKPFENFGLIVFLEYLDNNFAGWNLADQTDDAPPNNPTSLGFDGGFTFWQWWGLTREKIDQTTWTLPFTGWREVYADCIFHEHDQNNIIATINYKEGLMLGHVNKIAFDAYITSKAGLDTSGNEWNNYFKIGQGFRIHPFSSLDLNISFEYLWGRYTRGDFNNTPASISEFVVTADMFHGW